MTSDFAPEKYIPDSAFEPDHVKSQTRGQISPDQTSPAREATWSEHLQYQHSSVKGTFSSDHHTGAGQPGFQTIAPAPVPAFSVSISFLFWPFQ